MPSTKRFLLITLATIGFSGSVRSEEKLTPVMTALSHTTLSGYVSTSAIWHPGNNFGIPGRYYWPPEFFEYLLASATLNDGLPSSSTALLADSAFETFAFSPGSGLQSTNAFSGFQNVRFQGGETDFVGLEGEQYHVSLPGRVSLADRISLGWNFNISRAEQARESIDRAGMTVGFPISLLKSGSAWNWEVSPFAGFLWGRSEGLFAGGYVIQFGLAQSISYTRDWFTIRMGNQISGMVGASFEENNITYDPNVDQQITKNGLEMVFALPADFSLRVFGIHTYLLQDAPLDQYGTVGSTIGYAFGENNWLSAEVGIRSDFGENYDALAGTAGFGLKF